MKLILRLIVLPAFFFIQLITAICVVFIHSLNFIKWGGEAIIYTQRNQAKTILDIYEKIAEQQTDKEENERLIKKLNQLKGVIVAKEHLKKY